MIEIIVLIPTFLVCLFLLFTLSRHDFVLLRQNISLSQIFDLAFITLFSAFIIGRLLFIVNILKFELIHPLSFFHLIRYPGISDVGFFIGGAFAMWLFFQRKKGLARIYDIFSISFLPLYLFLLASKDYPQAFFYIPVIFIVITLVFFVFFLRSYRKYILKDGAISLILLALICIDSFLSQFFVKGGKEVLVGLTLTQVLAVVLFFISIIYYFIRQKKKY